MMKTYPKWVRAPETTNQIPEYLVIIREAGLRSRFFPRISGFYPRIFLAVKIDFPNTWDHSLQLFVIDSDFTDRLRLRDDRHQVISLSQGRFFRRDDI
ncbi:MAG: hypothetical protein PWP61_620 [Trichococcus sp.]|jgi:hypothetical protein|nr:hypothetical protein [Trichococcus sp.]